jgi:hypothetical protein
MQRYRVHTPLLGVYATGASKGFVSIPSGAILAAEHNWNADTIYVRVQWDNCELLVFPCDLAERTVKVEIRPESAA